METAHIYFAAMVLIMGSMSPVNAWCWYLYQRHPELTKDARRRFHAKGKEATKAGFCAAMIYSHYDALDWMISLCATDPMTGFIFHFPTLVFMPMMLWFSTRHLLRLRAQVKEL